MDETFLYRQIAESIRQEILAGGLKAGDRLPSVRDMAARWGCTNGTIQRAYQELVQQGLVTSRAGQGTRVVANLPASGGISLPLRRAALVHRAEAFLLEVLTAGYAIDEVEGAVGQALERWRIQTQVQPARESQVLRFAGSHDLALSWLAVHLPDILPDYALDVQFCGSLGGLIALAEGQADLAGCHLLDGESQQYNLPYLRRVLPGRRVAVVNLSMRRLGLVLAPGNPLGVGGLKDLQRSGLRFINRQLGSGTRVWFDLALRQSGIDPHSIQGYPDEEQTHSAVARRVAEGYADAGIGLEAAARSYGLDFILLAREPFDLVIPAEVMSLAPVKQLVAWLQEPGTRTRIEALGGYETANTGQITWIE